MSDNEPTERDEREPGADEPNAPPKRRMPNLDENPSKPLMDSPSARLACLIPVVGLILLGASIAIAVAFGNSRNAAPYLNSQSLAMAFVALIVLAVFAYLAHGSSERVNQGDAVKPASPIPDANPVAKQAVADPSVPDVPRATVSPPQFASPRKPRPDIALGCGSILAGLVILVSVPVTIGPMLNQLGVPDDVAVVVAVGVGIVLTAVIIATIRIAGNQAQPQNETASSPNRPIEADSSPIQPNVTVGESIVMAILWTLVLVVVVPVALVIAVLVTCTLTR